MQFPLPFQSPEEKSGGFSLASGLKDELFALPKISGF
jgi:hypothetical protein